MISSIRTDRQRHAVAIDNGQDLDALAATCRADFGAATLGTGKCRVDKTLALVNFASVTQLIGELGQNLTQDLAFAPLLKTSMHRLIVWIALRKHVPLRAGVQTPQHRVEYSSRRYRLAARTTIGNVLLGKVLPNPLPLLVA